MNYLQIFRVISILNYSLIINKIFIPLVVRISIFFLKKKYLLRE